MKYADIKLAVPKGKHSPEKRKAYKQHWRGIAEVRDELSRAYIHDGVSIAKVCDEAQIARSTGQRFFEFGKGGGKLTYSYLHGPAATTVFGIAGALGLRFKLVKKGERRG
jgi:hypothetical protein